MATKRNQTETLDWSKETQYSLENLKVEWGTWPLNELSTAFCLTLEKQSVRCALYTMVGFRYFCPKIVCSIWGSGKSKKHLQLMNRYITEVRYEI